MSEHFIRAKSAENKRIRAQQIMDAADRQFHEVSYHQITLSTIAAEVGIARAGLYKYVSSKEEVFLALFMQREREAVDAVVERVRGRRLPVPEFAREVAQVLEDNLDFFKYFQILNAIIETNVSVERLAKFKKESAAYRQDLLDLLARDYGVPDGRVFDFYLTVLYHCVYLYDRVVYADTYVQAIELAGLAIEPVDFVADLSHFVEMCLQDMREKRRADRLTCSPHTSTRS